MAADKKITELPAATLPILGSGAKVELVQGGVNVQTDPDNIGGGTVPDADATTKGIAKLYTDVASQNTDGAPDQNAVFDALALKAPLASPTFTGTPTAPTAAAGTNTTQVATTAFVIANATFVETATIYVDAAGSDSTGILGRADKPFLTITAALAAGVGVASLRIKIGMGTFVSPAVGNLRSNLWLEGSGKPGYNNTNTTTAFTAITITDPTALLGGTILQGQVYFQDRSNVHVTDLGVDCGSAYVTGGGTEGNQLIFISATAVAPFLLMSNIVVKNVTTLGRTAGSLFHAIQCENCFKPLIVNCDTYFSTHGVTIKSYGGMVVNHRGNFHTTDAVVIKTDTYAIGWINQLDNFEIQGGGGITIDIGTGPSTGGVNGVRISNGIIRSVSFGIKVNSSVGSQFVSYVNINNVTAYGVTGIGIELDEVQSSVINNCTVLGAATGYQMVNTIGNTFNAVLNSLAESCTLGYNISATTSSAIVRNCLSRGNTTGWTFTGTVYASGLTNDTNGTNYSGSVIPINIERGKFFFGSTGVVAPSAIVQLVAGTTVAATAPLKFTTGTSMTAAEAGAVEYTTDDLFFTIGTGTARKRFVFADPVGGLTSGRVSFSTTNGRQTDSSALTFAGSTLTATQLQIGAGAIVTGHLTGTAVLDFGSTVAGTSTDLTITVTGAADGDVVMLGVPNASTLANGVFTAWVSAANTVTVRFSNNSLAATLDPASGTFRASVMKY